MLQGKDHVEVTQALPGDIVRGRQGRGDRASTPCCTTPPRTTTSTSSRWSSRCRCTAWRSSRSAAATSSACRRSCTSWSPRTRACSIEHIAGTNETVVYGLGELHLRDLLEQMHERTSSRSTRGRRASPTARRSPRRPRATTATRSRPAAPASSARCSCASSRCRAATASSSSTRSRAATIPGQFIPAVEKGVREVLNAGALAGYPVEDVRVIVYDGKHHRSTARKSRSSRPGKQGVPRRDAARRGRSCSSRSSTSRSPRRSSNMGDITGDLSAQARPGQRHPIGAAPAWYHRRSRAAVRAQQLPGAPEIGDRRQGSLRHRAEPLRAGAAAGAAAARLTT